MRKLLTFLIALGAIVFAVVSPASAKGVLFLAGPKPITYQGPGDVVSSATFAFSVRAYSAATCGNKVFHICDPSNVTCADWFSDPTRGNLVATTNPLNGTDCTVSTSCTIQDWYDQSGNTSCSGFACDLVQATAANRPTFIWSCINNLPCLVGNGSSTKMTSAHNLTSASVNSSQSIVAIRTGNFTSIGPIWSSNNATQFRNLANAYQNYAGTTAQYVTNISDLKLAHPSINLPLSKRQWNIGMRRFGRLKLFDKRHC